MRAVVDNDIIYKAACYRTLDEFMAAIPADPECVGVLGATRFVLARKLKRAALEGDKALIKKDLESFFNRTKILEPSLEEIQLAGELEYLATKLGLRFDVGESQLCAILLIRSIPRLATGDKAAIVALAELHHHADSARRLLGKIICTEQLVRALSCNAAYWARVRSAICSEPHVDSALRAVMACTNPAPSIEDVLQGLDSYIGHLRLAAPGVLCEV
jgi:hypothetical protein